MSRDRNIGQLTALASAASNDILAAWDTSSSTTVGMPLSVLKTQLTSSGILLGPNGRKFAVVACVLRNSGTGWACIDDSVHSPINVDSVSVTATAIRVDYTSIGVTKVGTLLAVPDEAFASAGFFFGASVGTTYSDISLYRKREPIGGTVSYSGAAWSVDGAYGSLAYSSFTAGTLTLTHSTAASTIPTSVTSGNGTYVPVISAVTSTSIAIQFYDWTGALVTTADTNMKAYIHRAGVMEGAYNPTAISTATVPGSNIWVFGLFEVA